MKKIIKLGLILLGATAFTMSAASATGSTNDKPKEMKCQAGKCGDSMKKDAMKKMDGKCGASMKKDAKKKMDGKCGEGKCGSK
ncbi:hypothetical protein MNB_SV-5-73 [hydrothermal vent metagenome]|uniref:Low-complexity protein n=1 Tax=hydrothermal vent metagenome TaxID=652676 RepID=A0A1W1EFI3_9ZZZZ